MEVIFEYATGIGAIIFLMNFVKSFFLKVKSYSSGFKFSHIHKEWTYGDGSHYVKYSRMNLYEIFRKILGLKVKYKESKNPFKVKIIKTNEK